MALPKVLRITHSTDNTTIVNNDQIVTVKDIAIDGILADLASVRGQIGNAKEMPDLDFDTLTTPGNYRITGYPTNGPSLPLNISGASIGSLIVAGIPGQNGRIFQIMISDSVITWRTILTSTGETWSAWQQLLSANKVGDGIRVTNGIISVPEYEGATASKAGTSGLVPPAAAGQQESFLTGGGEYKPALSTSGGTVTGNLSIKNLLDLIGTAPATEQELGLYLLDKNNNVMGGHDFVHNTRNLKASQMYARNSNGLISSLGVYVEEDGTRYTLSSHNLVLTSDVEIGRLYADGVRLIKFSGAHGNEGLAMRYSPDSGELYLDGRAVHGKADSAGYADTAGSANALGGKAESALSVAYARDSGAMNGKAESALSVAFASEAQNSYGLKGMDMIIARTTYTLPNYGTWKYMFMIADASHFYDMVIGEDPGGTVLSASAWGSSAFMDGIAFRSA